MNSVKFEEILIKVIEQKYSAFFYTPPIYEKAVSYYFKNPIKTVTAKTKEEVNGALEILNKKKLMAYTLINYETGYALEKSLNKYFKTKGENLLINIFDKSDVKKYDSKDIKISPIGYNDYKIEKFQLNVNEEEYKDNIEKIKQYLIEGDTYQVNFTLKSTFDFSGDYTSLFKSLTFNQSAKYSAFINLGEKILFSIAPELFFETDGKSITVLPMKGTSRRGKNINEDIQNLFALRESEKDRAENVMIVDLLRNDIGKICEFGSVKANELFSVEKYESLYQMVSKVSGKLKDEISIGDLIKNIFPCGSVTGAPKIRTMEIINKLEKEQRGIYTGAIGIIDNGKAVFNVAIRTLVIDKQSGKGELGLGSGIVIDSEPDKEYEEVKLKGRFLSKTENYFELFETMLIENGVIADWNKHAERLKQAAEYFLFAFNNEEIDRVKEEIIQKIQPYKNYRLKLVLNKTGDVKYEISDYTLFKGKVKIILSKKRISSDNKFQYFKTTNRKLYNDEFKRYKKQGFFDVIFLNENGKLAEGTISNIFVKINDKWLTPKIECGILDGIERRKLLNENIIITEELISLNDLKKAENIILTNSLRGKTYVDELYINNVCINYLSTDKDEQV